MGEPLRIEWEVMHDDLVIGMLGTLFMFHLVDGGYNGKWAIWHMKGFVDEMPFGIKDRGDGVFCHPKYTLDEAKALCEAWLQDFADRIKAGGEK